MHQRRLIRAAVVAALINSTSADARVFPTRVVPHRVKDLPVISVYILDEDVDSDSSETAPRELTRNPSVTLECWVAPGTNVDDAMDDFAEEVENAMDVDPYFGGTAADSILNSTVMESLTDSDREIGFLVLSYDVKYRTEPLGLTAPLDDFNTANTTHNPGGDVHEDDVATDSITVQV